MLNIWTLCVLFVLVAVKNVCNGQVFSCVSDCAPAGNIVGTANSEAACCAIGVGFEFPGQLSTCQTCSDFEAAATTIMATANPMQITVGDEVTFECSVTTPPGATGPVSWILPDGSKAVTENITTSPTSVPLVIASYQPADNGEYVCEAEVTPTSGNPITLQGIITLGDPSISSPAITEDNPPVAGNEYSLTCTVASSGANLQWTDPDGNVLTTGSGITVGPTINIGSETTSTLTFSGISLEDSGKYQCTTDAPSPSTTTKTVIVSVPQPLIDIPSTTSPPVEGQPYSQICGASTPSSLEGDLTVTWLGPDGMVLSSGNGMDSTSALLSIPNFGADDSGTYTCEVTVSSTLLPRPTTTEKSIDLEAPPAVDCNSDPSLCDLNASCVSEPEGFQCMCNDGFTGNGTICTAIPVPGDNCTANPDICSDNAECMELTGECVCISGYTGNGTFCEDIDECTEGTDNCFSTKHVCVNTPGGFECNCVEGYRGIKILNFVLCLDINECRGETAICSGNAKCRNTPGSYTCTCKDGYDGDGITCCRQDSSNTKSMSTSKSKSTKTSSSSSSSSSTSHSSSTASSDRDEDECFTTEASESQSQSSSERSSTS